MPQPVLVTGCSTGIGLAVASHLAAQGVPVFATVRRDADAARLAGITGIEALICDVTDDAQVARLREAIDARGDGLWGIVHNAGIAHLGHLTTTSLEDLRAVFEVNVFGVHRVTHALVDLIVASRGRIVTMSSLSGTLSSPLLGAYSMSKHALEAYTDALAKQLAPLGVHVCAVAPGNYASAIARNAVGRFAPPADASEDLAALYAPEADTSRSEFPGPEPVAAACHAALFDEAPLERYLVVPIADEADRTLGQAAHEWARLNASTPHRWSTERLVAEVDTGLGDAASVAGDGGRAARNAALVRRLYQRVFVDWDWTMVDEVVDPAFVSHDWPAGLEGPVGFRTFYERALLANGPDARYVVDDLVAEGDRVVVRWRILATHTHEWFGVPPTGRPLTLEGMAIYRVQDDRLMERWVVLDGLGSAERLRADP
jgi:NAD(P)-dependent dehydrogenase (short-subunit alcohol dehydrogenase family)/predicted ester cyclase